MGGHRERGSAGRFGARFPTTAQAARHTPDTKASPLSAPERPALPARSSVGRAGARFPSARAAAKLTEVPKQQGPQQQGPDKPSLPEPVEVITEAEVLPEAAPPTQRQQDEDWALEADLADSGPFGPRTLVRPYVLTRGRTQARRHLAIEALVSSCSSARWNSTQVPGEFRSVRRVCHQPRSVAEVAATLSVPLGVVRVLIDDMADLGLVTIHETTDDSGKPALALLERVLHGLHRL
ncbi:DUF742 domain-containing protein [Amycolatopsis sp. NPDC059027]|uniref:DUF742 domain-containing protein n=1 Tax=unclassified Amycolatopsis TaxID=2618356 RepID=UPI00366E76CD